MGIKLESNIPLLVLDPHVKKGKFLPRFREIYFRVISCFGTNVTITPETGASFTVSKRRVYTLYVPEISNHSPEESSAGIQEYIRYKTHPIKIENN